MEAESIRKNADLLLSELLAHAGFVRGVEGKGRLGKVDSLLGRGQGYCARFLGDEFAGVDLGEFLAMLVALRVDVRKFFCEALTFHPERFLWQLEGVSPNEVRYLKKQLRWARTDRRPSDLATVQERVAELEERRMLERGKVKRECIQLLGVLGQPETPEGALACCKIFGVLGAICRTQGSLSSAAFCHRSALGLASRLVEEGSRFGVEAKARTLRRVAYLVSDLGQLEDALGLVLSVRKIYAKNQDEQAVGRTLVDSGTFLGMQGRFEEAAQDFEESLGYLQQADWRYRISAFQGLGLCHSELDRSADALGFLKKALREVRERGFEAMAHWLYWLRGRILLKEKDWAGAEVDFRAVRATLLSGAGSPLDLALASLELAKALLLQGKIEGLREVSTKMMPLVGKLKSTPLLAAAMERYLLSVWRGEVSLKTIEETYKKLRDVSQAETPLPVLKSLAG